MSMVIGWSLLVIKTALVFSFPVSLQLFWGDFFPEDTRASCVDGIVCSSGVSDAPGIKLEVGWKLEGVCFDISDQAVNLCHLIVPLEVKS